MFLSDDDLIELTGYQKPAMQRKWLIARGWPFEENASGRPRVLRAYVEQQMGVKPTTRRQGPNLAAIL